MYKTSLNIHKLNSNYNNIFKASSGHFCTITSNYLLALQGEEQRKQNKSCINASSVDGALKARGETVLFPGLLNEMSNRT